MSTRTLIEINHDYLIDILDSPEKMAKLRLALSMGGGERYPFPAGVKMLSQRHHTETFYLAPEDSKLFAHNAVIEEARTRALEQRCERGTPWDLACTTAADKIGEMNPPPSKDSANG